MLRLGESPQIIPPSFSRIGAAVLIYDPYANSPNVHVMSARNIGILRVHSRTSLDKHCWTVDLETDTDNDVVTHVYDARWELDVVYNMEPLNNTT